MAALTTVLSRGQTAGGNGEQTCDRALGVQRRERFSFSDETKYSLSLYIQTNLGFVVSFLIAGRVQFRGKRVGLLWKGNITGKVPHPQRASMQSSDFMYIAKEATQETGRRKHFFKNKFQ